MKGGSRLSQENQSYLRFSLEESVWFQKGQEVAELVSISLDPNITIVENDLYVAIRGSLELTGEYKRFQEEEESEKEDDITAPKFIQTVEERDEGICEFIHRFPVDITIPNNRIQSVYDIDVTVDSFDCLLPERSCLKLIADLTISGLYGEQQNVPLVDVEREPELEPNVEPDLESIQTRPEYAQEEIDYGQEQPSYWNETAESQEFLAAVRQSEYDEQDEQTGEDDATSKPYLNAILGRPAETETETEENEFEFDDEIYKPFSAEAKKQPEIAPAPEYSWGKQHQAKVENNTLADEAVPKKPEVSYSAQRENQTDAVTGHDEDYNSPETPVSNVEQFEESPSVSSEQQKVKKKKSSKKKSMSIAEFLGRKTENEEHVKLKVCIVQNGETLDSLSERYELPVQQILRVNHLEASQDVYEGQVLYIPEGAAHR